MTDISELNALRARIDQLEAEARRDNVQRAEQVTTRRNMLRLAGAAAVGGLAAAVVADPVAAADPNDVVLNLSTNPGTTPTGISMAASAQAYGLGCYEIGLGTLNASLGRPAVFGHATGTAFTNGVAGHNTVGSGVGVLGLDTSSGATAIGVKAKSSTGTGLVAESGGSGIIASGGLVGVFAQGATGVGVTAEGANGALLLSHWEDAAPPTRAGTFQKNTLETDAAGNVWFCYEDGTPGKWRKVAGPATAGAFHAVTPTRVYDSRAGTPLPTGALAAGGNRTVSVADGRNSAGAVTVPDLVPAGATAVTANITVTGTVNGGFLSLNPGGNLVAGASTINWFGSGQTLANGVTLTLNASRQVTVICGSGSGGSTGFIIDISGYYL